jgi:hypothetical protein
MAVVGSVGHQLLREDVGNGWYRWEWRVLQRLLLREIFQYNLLQLQFNGFIWRAESNTCGSNLLPMGRTTRSGLIRYLLHTYDNCECYEESGLLTRNNIYTNGLITYWANEGTWFLIAEIIEI